MPLTDTTNTELTDRPWDHLLYHDKKITCCRKLFKKPHTLEVPQDGSKLRLAQATCTKAFSCNKDCTKRKSFSFYTDCSLLYFSVPRLASLLQISVQQVYLSVAPTDLFLDQWLGEAPLSAGSIANVRGRSLFFSSCERSLAEEGEVSEGGGGGTARRDVLDLQ